MGRPDQGIRVERRAFRAQQRLRDRLLRLGREVEAGHAVPDDLEGAAVPERDGRPSRCLDLGHGQPEVLGRRHDQALAAGHRPANLLVRLPAEEPRLAAREPLQPAQVRALADDVERHPEALGRGNGEVDPLVGPEPRDDEEPAGSLRGRRERRRLDGRVDHPRGAAVGAPDSLRRELGVGHVDVDVLSRGSVQAAVDRQGRAEQPSLGVLAAEVFVGLPQEARRRVAIAHVHGSVTGPDVVGECRGA